MSERFRILVTGGRDWCDAIAVQRALTRRLIEHGSIAVVHGNCPTGADLFAKRWAEERILYGMHRADALVSHEYYSAPWDEMDKSAGPIRNRYMVQLGADICLAFPTVNSRGTISCMDLAAAAGIPVVNLGVPRHHAE